MGKKPNYRKVFDEINKEGSRPEGYDELLLKSKELNNYQTPEIGIDTRSYDTNLASEYANTGDIFNGKIFKDYQGGVPFWEGEDYLKETRAQHQSVGDRVIKMFPRISTKVLSEVAKLPGYIGGAIDWASTGFQQDEIGRMVDNAWINTIQQGEDYVKNEIFPVYTPKSVQEGGLWANITSSSFWATEGADGVGFLVSMLIPGQVLKAGKLGTLGAKGIGKVAKVMKPGWTGVGTKGITGAIKGADTIDNLSATLVNTLFESASEAGESFDKVKNQLIAQGYSEEEAKSKAGETAVETLLTNFVILLGPNALTQNQLFKAFSRTKGIDKVLGESGEILSNVAKKSFKQNLPLYGKEILKTISSEGFFEEGLQFASSQYFEDKALGKVDDYDTYMEGILDTYLDNIDNVDMQKSIFLGGVLGGGMAMVGTKNKIDAENARLFGQSASNPSKFKKLLGAKERPEQKGLLHLLKDQYSNRYKNFEEIYKKDAKGDYILNSEGKREVDPAKLEEFKASVINADAMNLIQQAALAQGDQLTYDYYKNIKDFQDMIPFLQQPEGMELLTKRIEHLAEMDALYIKDVLQMDSSKTTQEIKADLINKAKKFQKIYESVEGTHDVFNKISFNKEDEVAFKDYSADLKSAKMSMAITQDFLESKIQELTNKALSIDPRFEVGKINPELVSPQKNAEIEKINKELKALTESLEESVKESKKLYDEKTQQKLYEEYLANKKEVEKEAKNTEANIENFTRDIENAGYKVKANENSIDVLDRSVQGIHLLFKGKPYRLVRLDNEDKSKEGTYLVNDSNQSIKINAAWVKENYKSIQVIPIDEARESIRSRRVKAIKDNSVKAILALTNEFESKKKAINSDISKLEDDILDTMIEIEEIQDNLKKGIGHKASLKKAIRKAEETIAAIEKQVEELKVRKKNIDDVITTLEQYKQRVINENVFSFKKELTKLEEEVDRDGINSLPELIKISSELDELITNLETQKVKLENYLDVLYTIDAESRLTEALLLKDIEVAWFKEKYKGLNYRTTIADVRKMSKSVSNFINTKRGDKSKLEFVNEIIEDLNTLNDLEESAKRSLEELQFVSSEITANEEELSKLNTNLKELKEWRARVELKKPLLTLATLYDALKKRYEKYKTEAETVVPANQVALTENNEPTNDDNNSPKSFITIIDNTALSTELWFTTGKNIMYDEKGTEYDQNGVPSVNPNEYQKRWFSFTQKVELKDEKGHDKFFIKIVSPQQEFPGFEDLKQQLDNNLGEFATGTDLVALVIDKSTGQPLIYNGGYVFTSINTPSRLFDNSLNVTIPTIVSNYQALTGSRRFDALTKEGGFYNPSTGHFHQSNLAGTVEVNGIEALSIMVDKVRESYAEQFVAIHKAIVKDGAKVNVKIKGISNGIPQKYKRNEDGTKRLKPVKSQLSLDNATIVLNKFGIPVIEYPDGRYAYLDRRNISPLEADLIIALLAKTVTTSSKEGLTIFNIDAKVPLPKGNYLAGNPKKTSVDIIPHRQGELGLLSLLINWGGPAKGQPLKEGHVYVDPISMEVVFMYNNSIERLPLNLVDDSTKNQLFKEFLESRPININKGALSNDKFIHFQPKLRGGNIDFETFSSYTDFLTSGKESPLQTDIVKSTEAEGIQFASRNFALNTNPSGRLVIEEKPEKQEIEPDVLPQEYDPNNIVDDEFTGNMPDFDFDEIKEAALPSGGLAGLAKALSKSQEDSKESPGMSASEKLDAIIKEEEKETPVSDKKADTERGRQEKYNTQYNALVAGQVLDNEGDPVYEEDKGIGSNGLSTLTDKKYGHGHIRTSGLDSLKVLESLLDGSDFSGMFGQIGVGEYSTWESGKFIIVSNNINPTTNNKLNLNEIEVILNAGLSPFAQELANKYPNVTFKDFNGKKYDAELDVLENPLKGDDKLLVTPDYKRGNIKEALKNLEKIFGAVFTQDDVKIISGLIEGRSLGRFTRDGKILLSDELAEGTEYHEAFHRVFRVLIGEANKQDLINEFKTRKDYLELIEAKRKEGYTGTEEKLIEEVLADEFMEYMLSGKLQKPEGEKSKSVFQRMWEWLKKFFGVMDNPSTKAEVFRAIRRGRFSSLKKSYLYQAPELDSDADKLKVGDIELTPAETTALMKGLTTELLNLVYDKGAIYNFLKAEPSDLKKLYVLSINNALNNISNKISSLKKEYINEKAKGIVDEGLASDFFRLSSIYLAINSNKDSIIKKHSEYLKEFNITIDEIKADETTSDEDSIPEDQRKKQSVEWTPSVEISVKERMTRAIKLMAATLPKISKIINGIPVIESNDLGLVETEDYRKVTAQLFNILAGVPADPYRFIEEIEKSSFAKYAPILKQRLGFGDKSFGKQKLRNEFTQAFAKTKLNFITGVINFDGSVSIVNSNSQAVRDSIIQEWGSNISATIQNNPKILDELNKYKNSISSDKARAEIYRLLNLEVNEKLLSDSYFDNALLAVVNAVINSKDASINDTVKALQKRNNDKGAAKSFRTLAEAQAKYDVNNELQVFNADNKLVYSVTLNSYQSQVIDGLNYFGYEDAKEYFPHLYNVYTTNSKWLGNIKAEKKMRNLLLDGFKSEGKEAMKIDNLKEADLYSFFLNGLLTQGIYPSMKHADRSLIPAYQFDDRSLILPIERDALGLEAQAQLIMRGYLADEINRYKVSRTDIQNYDTNLDGKPGQYNPLGNVLFNNPEINRIWNRILQDTKNKSIVTPKDLDLEYINAAVQKYLNSMATEMEFTLKKHNVGVNNAGISKELYSNYSFSHIVKAFAWNTYFGNIEQIKLFSGDAALYSKPDEFFKRLNMQSSTGEVCVVNEENNNYISDLNRAVNLTINGKVIKYKQSANGLSQEIVLADNQFSSSVLSSIEMMLSQGLNEELTSVENSNIAAKTKEYTEELVGAYEDFIENDGFSFTNIFEWREWLHRAGKWSKEAENVFNREIEWLNIEHSNLSPEEKKKEQYKLFTIPEGTTTLDYINKYNGVPVIYKPQYTGPVYQNTLEEYTAEDPATRVNIVAGRKTSFLILMPSMIKGTPLETLNNHLLSSDTGFVFWNGSAKFGTNKITSAFYNKEGKFDVNAIAQVPRTNLDYRFLKHQLEISNKPKEFIPNSTQSAKNMIANMYSKGTPKSELAKEHFEEYNKTIENLIQRKIEKFLKDIDTVIVTESKEFDKLPTYNIKSLNKFKEVLLAAAKSRNSARNILEAIDEFNKDGKFTFLEGLPNKERINSILNSMITSSVLVLKRPGNAMPQASIMGLETEGRELVNNNRIKSSTESLKFYEPIVKDGKIEGTNKAEFIIPLPHKWIDWVMKAANTNSLEEAIDWINNEIAEGKLDTELTTKDLRIPNQQTSSNDIFKVKKFINPLTYASIAFVPSELVAKTGGDFDIDKLQIYYKNLVGDSKAGLKAIKFLDNSNSTEQKRYDNLVYEKYKNVLKPLQTALREMSKDIKTKTDKVYDLLKRLEGFEELAENPEQEEMNNLISAILGGIKDMDEAFEVEDTLRQEEEDVITLTLKRDQLIEELQKIKSAISNEFSFEEFKKLSIENQNTKEAVENRLLEIEEKILLAPYNIRNLMTAVSDDYLKNTLMPKITKKTLGQAYTAKQYGENSNSWHNIPSPLNNVNKLLEFLWGSQGIGIIATEITHAAVAQAAGVKVNPYFNVTKNGETKPFSTEIPFEIMKGIYDFSASHDVLSERQITDILSGLLNTQVDVVKNPYPLALGIMLQSLPVITYMVRRGVPLEYTLQFITSKSIQEYLLKQRNNQSFVAKSKGRKSMFNPNGMVVDNEVLSNEILEKYPIIEKGKYLTLKDLESNANTYQGNILDAYLNIVEQAKAATDVKKLLSPDTKYYKTMEDAKQVYTTLIKDIKASNIISTSDIQKVLDTTFLGAFYEGNRMYYALFKNLSKFETANIDVVEAIEKNLEVTLKTQFTQEAKEKAISLFYNELITYIIQNNSDDFKGAFEKLFEGDKSLAKRVIKAKKRKEFKDNQFIQLLLPEVNRRENGRDNLRMKQQGFQTIEINSLLDYLEEVSQYDNELYEDLVKFSFMQSGIGNSPYNFSKLLDNAGLSKYRDVFNNAVLSKSDINNFFIKFQEANPSLFDSKEEVENTVKDSVYYQNYRDTILEGSTVKETPDVKSKVTTTPKSNPVKDFINSLTNEQKVKLKKVFGSDDVIRIINESFSDLPTEEAVEAIKCKL